ncbi:MAG: GNAT family N-acetyltransferase [Gammaproteobacteria bacterium]|jgi:predicted GNAT family N-acyltransferase
MNEPEVRVREADWRRDEAALMAVRTAVFVDEQGVPAALEREERDAAAVHWLARTPAGMPVGTTRLLPDGQIGRMAVLPAWRGRGIGTRLLNAALRAAATQGLTSVYLHAQCTALPFYARAGFSARGEVFEEAGILHRRMELDITEPGPGEHD